MAISSRLIRRRIRSVTNTRKITKAMELVAAAKMRRAVQLALSSREYSGSLREIVETIRPLIPPTQHALLAGRPVARRTLVVVAASDRGLCGGFNAQLLKKTLAFLSERQEQLTVVTIGKRAETAVRRAGYEIVAAFEAVSNAPSFERVRPIAELAFREFIEERVDRIFAVYTDFKSALSQIPTVTQLLPIIPENELKALSLESTADTPVNSDPSELGLLFEPSAAEVLDQMLPRLFDTRIYQALLESSASEHSARMLAMRNATENASEMLSDLIFTYNQARQASITREISEISAGKAALE